MKRSETSLSRTTGGATGIVLAGGRSTRFGTDKLAAIHRGVPLLHHAVSRVWARCARRSSWSSRRTRPEPSMPPGATTGSSGTSVEGEGPLVGLVSGLEAASTELAFVAGGDMPDLSTAVLLEMLRVAGEARRGRGRVGRTATGSGRSRASCGSLPHGTPRRRWSARASDRSAALLQALRTAVIDEPTWTTLDPSRGTLNDVDEPEDLDR